MKVETMIDELQDINTKLGGFKNPHMATLTAIVAKLEAAEALAVAVEAQERQFPNTIFMPVSNKLRAYRFVK